MAEKISKSPAGGKGITFDSIIVFIAFKKDTSSPFYPTNL